MSRSPEESTNIKFGHVGWFCQHFAPCPCLFGLTKRPARQPRSALYHACSHLPIQRSGNRAITTPLFSLSPSLPLSQYSLVIRFRERESQEIRFNDVFSLSLSLSLSSLSRRKPACLPLQLTDKQQSDRSVVPLTHSREG
jgi:hypothetical protein